MRSRDRANPLAYGGGQHDWRGGHAGTSRVKHVYGFGYSQTGGDLYDYINAIHPLDVARNGGHPIYDGYIVAVAGGGFVGIVPINQCEAASAVPATRACSSPTSACRSSTSCRSRTTCSASPPAVPTATRRPTATATTRWPAPRHATPDELNFAATPADIVKAGVAVPPMNCDEGPRSRFPSRIFFDAMLRNLDLWVRYGIRPPHADPIDGRRTATPACSTQFGNVVGGLRSPYLDVPTSTWFGNSTGASFCVIAGHEVPFDAARLQQLYPTHGAYVRAVVKDTARLVAGRYITGYDGLDLIREAAHRRPVTRGPELDPAPGGAGPTPPIPEEALGPA